MLANPALDTGGRFNSVFKALFFVFVAVYLADCFTPLRIHLDSMRYYAIKDYIETGTHPFGAEDDYFPYGFTALLLVLSKLGILTSFTIVLINFIYLFGGMYFIYKMYKGKVSYYLFFLLMLVNWLIVKYAAHPLSEMQYVFFAMGGLYFFHRFAEGKKLLFLVPAFFFAWLAFMTKTVGITLIGALGVGLIWQYKEQQLAFLKNNKILVGFIILALIAAVYFFSKFLGIDHYGGVLSKHFKEASFFTRVEWRFKEWGEIFVNLPSNKVERYLGNTGNLLFSGIGVVVFAWFLYAMFYKRSWYPFYLKAYFVFYCIIMFNWPFNDPRFWVPVMPVMAVVIARASFPGKFMKILSRLWLVMYVALGLFAAGYMVYTTFNRKVFAKTQANGVYRNQYEKYFFGKPQSDTARPDNQWNDEEEYIYYMMQHYNK